MSITQPRFTDLDVVHINTEAALRSAHPHGCLIDAAPLPEDRLTFAPGSARLQLLSLDERSYIRSAVQLASKMLR